MGIVGLIRKLFGADGPAPPDATKLDGTTEAALARSLSALPAHERGWLTLAEARTLFSTKGDQYAFGELDQDGRKNIKSFAAQHRAIINFMPMEERVYFRARSNRSECPLFPRKRTSLSAIAIVRFVPKADIPD